MKAKREKIISVVCRSTYMESWVSLPTKEEFVRRFIPEYSKAWETSVPYGGIKTTKLGRTVDWSRASNYKIQATKRENFINEVYDFSCAIIAAEIEKRKSS